MKKGIKEGGECKNFSNSFKKCAIKVRKEEEWNNVRMKEEELWECKIGKKIDRRTKETRREEIRD